MMIVITEARLLLGSLLPPARKGWKLETFKEWNFNPLIAFQSTCFLMMKRKEAWWNVRQQAATGRATLKSKNWNNFRMDKNKKWIFSDRTYSSRSPVWVYIWSQAVRQLHAAYLIQPLADCQHGLKMIAIPQEVFQSVIPTQLDEVTIFVAEVHISQNLKFLPYLCLAFSKITTILGYPSLK